MRKSIASYTIQPRPTQCANLFHHTPYNQDLPNAQIYSIIHHIITKTYPVRKTDLNCQGFRDRDCDLVTIQPQFGLNFRRSVIDQSPVSHSSLTLLRLGAGSKTPG
ncbi:hypothetical protein RRG08_060208 [Elysia crispata]|uniref:Uncharacterized protein n=1 Tax=Elysia crispata TaxID=231223 RepID=A0AAE1D0P8_9GAST|nr:hypothetical protein RRG08_060208 [Elysia crispata]